MHYAELLFLSEFNGIIKIDANFVLLSTISTPTVGSSGSAIIHIVMAII